MGTFDVSRVGGVRPPELVELAAATGPFVSLWMATPLGIGDADPLVPAWHTRRGELVSAGAPTPVVEQVGEAVADLRHRGEGIVVVADRDDVLLVEPLPSPPRAELARWAPLPSIAPVLEHRQAQVPYVVVLTDRRGADLVAVSPDQGTIADEAGVSEYPIRKVAPGGWSQLRYQRRAENTWEHNAHDVAAHVIALAERVQPVFVVVAGDVRALQLLDEAMPEDLRALVRAVSGGRADDGSTEQRDREIERLVRSAVAAATTELLEDFTEELGRCARAANGPERTLDALRDGRVDILLVHDDVDDERCAHFGPNAEQLGLTRDEITRLGVERPEQGRLVDAAIRAALGTGASVRVVPSSGPVSNGLGALLRWS